MVTNTGISQHHMFHFCSLDHHFFNWLLDTRHREGSPQSNAENKAESQQDLEGTSLSTEKALGYKQIGRKNVRLSLLLKGMVDNKENQGKSRT